MASRWLRWSRRPSSESENNAALAQLTGAFLDLDKRQSIAGAAVAAAAALTPQSTLEEEWEAVQTRCYEATAAYLGVANSASPATAEEARIATATDGGISHASMLLDRALASLDAFYDRHRPLLDSAVERVSALTADADMVAREAHAAHQSLAGAEQQLRGYPSVLQAREQLDAASARLERAREQSNLRATRKAVDDVRETAAVLQETLATAPQREEQARRAVTSVRTRIDAVRTRLAGLPPLLSALLREFNAGSSADLVYNDRVCQVHVERAEALIAQAAAARAAHRPEEALEFAQRARSELADAERDVNEVADRLALLREVRAEPDRRAREVRFRLRDAQRLAVDRGAVPEWGSVLDAQSERIDRIVEGIEGAHPDYWAYHQSLIEVTSFITNVVSRIRQAAVR